MLGLRKQMGKTVLLVLLVKPVILAVKVPLVLRVNQVLITHHPARQIRLLALLVPSRSNTGSSNATNTTSHHTNGDPMKHPAELTYAALRVNGSTRRYLLCRTEEKPHFGDPTFDFLGYFGFGSGEFEGQHPLAFDHIRVKAVKLTVEDPEYNLTFLAERMSHPTDAFSGFYTTDGKTFYLLVPDDKGTSLAHLPELYWAYYTNIGGDRETAYAHLRTLNRRHILFATPEEQDQLLTAYAQLAASI